MAEIVDITRFNASPPGGASVEWYHTGKRQPTPTGAANGWCLSLRVIAFSVLLSVSVYAVVVVLFPVGIDAWNKMMNGRIDGVVPTVGKWGPASAGKEEAGMVNGWTRGVQVKQARVLKGSHSYLHTYPRSSANGINQLNWRLSSLNRIFVPVVASMIETRLLMPKHRWY